MSAGPTTVDDSHRTPLVLIPGIQGRCEWMEPTIRALSPHFRVITFSLNDIALDGFFEQASRHVERQLDQAGVGRALVVGVSFGGLVATHFAATRPGRVTQLVVVSSPSPRWHLDARTARYVRHPIVNLPAFALRGAWNMFPELTSALPTWPRRLSFMMSRGVAALRWPSSPRRMATWVSAWLDANLAAVCGEIAAPTLVVTGESGLDRVVPVSSTLDYVRLIRRATHVTIPHTGHLGSLTKPRDFAAIVRRFSIDHDTSPHRDPVVMPSTTHTSYVH